ncbi:MAG: AAA family ATPase [Caldilinea sp.]|nr:AAA family ATPase [Caldilineaceae bacterium]MCO5211405.1 AAA family ATPase [Caldilinea sp.]MCW5844263.1 AAA family ATPase [Caldilinea sp.]HRW49019.1 AAA family ATPase [Caldilinea sp.]
MTPDDLSPSQREAVAMIERLLEEQNLIVIRGGRGTGKSTLARYLHEQHGGGVIGIREMLEASDTVHPMQVENAFLALMVRELARHDLLIIDDIHLLLLHFHGQFYPRAGLVEGTFATFAAYVFEADKRVVFLADGHLPDALTSRAFSQQIPPFTAGDYEYFGYRFLPVHLASAIDFNHVFRFARQLDVHQMRTISSVVRHQERITTDEYIDILRTHHLVSNVNLEEVQTVSLDDLRGLDDLIDSLKANIITPLENDALAEQLTLRPKRGVLLAGPPGTGKTTIGRALAHRLKSKFFLLDGTAIAGTGDFYYKLVDTFRLAAQSAPCIIFIDDSDVIFESGQEHGLYRFLLTQLDGLESKTAGKVCVIMTAMNVASLPRALVRSGRIELWLETRLPDATARREIIAQHILALPEVFNDVDMDRVVEESEGLTGADLKALVEDAKVRYAYDRVRELPAQPMTTYFLAAAESVREHKQHYASAEETLREDARARRRRDD